MSHWSRLSISSSLISVLLAVPAVSEDYVIDTDVLETNGGNTLDGEDSITVTEDGTVKTSGGLAYGLLASGDRNALTNSGSVKTSGWGAHGIFARGDGNALTNSGTVKTSGNDARGIWVSGDGNTVTNSGTVKAGEWAAHGLRVSGDGNTVTNSGTVTTRGDYARGILVSGDDNTVTNSGTVKTSDFFANGIQVSGDGNTVTNSGTVKAGGPEPFGILAEGNHSALTNSGTVETIGPFSIGLFARGDGNALTNSGTVKTSGNRAHGIWVSGDGSTLTNSGTVETSGDYAHGISVYGDGNALTNSGRIFSKYSSLYFEGSNATVSLARGSVLQGDVRFSDPNTATLKFGQGLDAVVRTNGGVPATITAFDDAYVVAGDTIYVVDVSGFLVPDQAIGTVGRLVLNALEDRTLPDNAVEVSRDGTGAPPVWAQVFGGYYDQDGYSGTAGYDVGIAGILVGTDIDRDRGFFLGVSGSHSESDNGFELDTRYLLGGYYAGHNLGTAEVDASLTLGAARNKSKRSVANNQVEGGLETASAKYNNYFIMPAATFKGDLPVKNGTLAPSLRLRYAAIWQEGYNESGSASRMDVDSRMAHLFDARLQVQRELAPYDTKAGMLLTTLRLGVDGQYLTQDDVSTTIAGQPLVFAPGDKKTSARGFMGLELQHLSDDGDQEWRVGIELGRTTYHMTDVTANIGWIMRF